MIHKAISDHPLTNARLSFPPYNPWLWLSSPAKAFPAGTMVWGIGLLHVAHSSQFWFQYCCSYSVLSKFVLHWCEWWSEGRQAHILRMPQLMSQWMSESLLIGVGYIVNLFFFLILPLWFIISINLLPVWVEWLHKYFVSLNLKILFLV